jgi:hypothetical protein
VKFFIAIILFFFTFIGAAFPQAPKEKDYQVMFCNQMSGTMEVRLLDATRVDCLTDEYAIEVEFAHKWAESVGQSLYYAQQTGKKPGVALIIANKEQEQAFYTRLMIIADKYNIRVWKIYTGFLGTVPRKGD